MALFVFAFLLRTGMCVCVCVGGWVISLERLFGVISKRVGRGKLFGE